MDARASNVSIQYKLPSSTRKKQLTVDKSRIHNWNSAFRLKCRFLTQKEAVIVYSNGGEFWWKDHELRRGHFQSILSMLGSAQPICLPSVCKCISIHFLANICIYSASESSTERDRYISFVIRPDRTPMQYNYT
ncbi:hypothetical protein Y032_0105g3685 [Ancylostoma ceylanicum]|uniref:Uncharacterized protein n=1 Tax=Ancylostoma ceylanicum TaxID=53326 RepID=A0A016TGF8_9BILA|nr:hypothetical protein Y032_0105g3685 [Ancylostoma ceylanicum]